MFCTSKSRETRKKLYTTPSKKTAFHWPTIMGNEERARVQVYFCMHVCACTCSYLVAGFFARRELCGMVAAGGICRQRRRVSLDIRIKCLTLSHKNTPYIHLTFSGCAHKQTHLNILEHNFKSVYIMFDGSVMTRLACRVTLNPSKKNVFHFT